MNSFIKKITLICVGVLVAKVSHAQTISDGFMMQKKQVCIATSYNHSSFTYYWEGTLLRENKSLGRLYNQNFGAMVAYGLGKNLNLLASLPYIKTNSGATTSGHQGLQDLSVGLKHNPVSITFSNDDKNNISRLNLFTIANFSMPASNYYPDYLPFSIGVGSRNYLLGATLGYLGAKGLIVNLNGSYTFRNNIKLERNFYYTDRAYYTNEVFMPNVSQFNASVGYRLNSEFRILGWYNQYNTLGGFDIRRNDMPFPSNNVDMSRISTELLYRPKELNSQWGIMAGGGYTLKGRNTGQTANVSFGIVYQTKKTSTN